MHHWTEFRPLEEADAPASSSKATDAKPDAQNDPPKGEYVLRPIWQRTGAVVGQFGLGAFVCVLLLNSRARIIRRLYLIPSSDVAPTTLAPKLPKPKPSSRQPDRDQVLVAQNVYHFRGQGNVFPLSCCRLTKGYDPNEVALEVAGVRGKFYLGLDGVTINDEPQTSTWNTREALFKLFYGSKGRTQMAKVGWI